MAGRRDVARSRTQAGGRRQHQQTPSLPIDIVLEIAACSDPTTLIRCAATCWEVRRRFADDPTFRGRLRLRHTDRFVLPLLRGHFVGNSYYDGSEDELWLVDTTAADATRLITPDECFASGPNGQHLMNGLEIVYMSSRGGLFLIRTHTELRVCDPATRHSHIIPEPKSFPGDTYYGSYVLLVGDGASGDASDVGRPFQVLKGMVATSEKYRSERCLRFQTFFSEHGTWGPYTEIRTPNLLGHAYHKSENPLVVDGVVHWLCLTDVGGYVLMLNVKAARVTLTTLPTRFPRINKPDRHISYLLATNSACGSPVVLVADEEKISMWVQLKGTKRWKEQPQVVIRNEEIPRFNNVGDSLEDRPETYRVNLEWFAERSGAVLIFFQFWCFFWLDLQSKKIVRWYPDTYEYTNIYCPYEMDLSSWVPTFISRL